LAGARGISYALAPLRFSYLRGTRRPLRHRSLSRNHRGNSRAAVTGLFYKRAGCLGGGGRLVHRACLCLACPADRAVEQ